MTEKFKETLRQAGEAHETNGRLQFKLAAVEVLRAAGMMDAALLVLSLSTDPPPP